MRAALDLIYRSSAVAAGFFLVGIAALSLSQIVGRLLGFVPHSADEFAGYCMAAATFLGLACTFRSKEHIRVTIVLERLSARTRKIFDIGCLVCALGIVVYFTWAAGQMTWTSYVLDDVSSGLLPVKLWIPQSSMAIGLLVLAIAIADGLWSTVARGDAYGVSADGESTDLRIAGTE